jgi:hypothetical protein
VPVAGSFAQHGIEVEQTGVEVGTVVENKLESRGRWVHDLGGRVPRNSGRITTHGKARGHDTRENGAERPMGTYSVGT